ncbi:MAG: hypothetical protein A2026_22505 [Deltaproteobacteria bacterium RBG_19FT_COMBO_46_12]|nr:MAG: hypothetical protein A2026_22505 [Deltaproteobacteria bacterium RBG_19FT_COMBO_46_12]
MNDSIKSTRGFSLIEILIAIVILSISLLGLAALMVTTTQNNSFGAHMSEATTFAQDMLERLRVSPWEKVVSGKDPLPIAGSTGINYDRNWVVSPNPISPNDTLRTVTITVKWNDKTDHSISVLSAIYK